MVHANDYGRNVNNGEHGGYKKYPLGYNYCLIKYVFLGEEDVEERDKVDQLPGAEVDDLPNRDLRIRIVMFVIHILIRVLKVQVEEQAKLRKHHVEPWNVFANVVKIVLLVLQIETVTLPFAQCLKWQHT